MIVHRAWFIVLFMCLLPFFFNDAAPTEIYTLSLHDALPISGGCRRRPRTRMRPGRWLPPPRRAGAPAAGRARCRSEEHTSELQSLRHLVCRLLLEKKNTKTRAIVAEAREDGKACVLGVMTSH